MNTLKRSSTDGGKPVIVIDSDSEEFKGKQPNKNTVFNMEF
jgi:hypothetical protein